MTVIERFVEFAGALPAERLHDLEDALASLMATYAPAYDFTPVELAELDRRVAEPRPQFAASEDIARLLRRT